MPKCKPVRPSQFINIPRSRTMYSANKEMAATSSIAILLVTLTISLSSSYASPRGSWELLLPSMGISAMHVALLPTDKLIAFDRTDFGSSNISLPLGRCRDDDQDQALPHDCSAHAVELDPSSLALRPLTVLTDTWCSSGHLTRDGILVQTGGFNDGERAVRNLRPSDGSDWEEDPAGLTVRRWYATNHILPDGDAAIVVGGRRQFSYEFVPKRTMPSTTFPLQFLKDTHDQQAENNLYPFVHLSPDGSLFIFANTKSILLDYANNKVLRTFPDMPGDAARNYPSTGSSVLLPLRLDQSTIQAHVMVCGGAPSKAYVMANKSIFVPAANTCGRITITDANSTWTMMRMPIRRVMGDMVLLPNGDVLLINGASSGSAGWGMGRNPVLSPVLYHVGATHDSDELLGTFEVLSPTQTPRLYHSTAHLLSDGRVFVGGSNPNVRYEFSDVLYPTELSAEAFKPPYMDGIERPRIVGVEGGMELRYGANITVRFEMSEVVDGGDVRVTMVAPAFTTHSYSMSQRVVVLMLTEVRGVEGGAYEVEGVAPEKAVIAPVGYYMLFVVVKGVPSPGVWVRIQ